MLYQFLFLGSKNHRKSPQLTALTWTLIYLIYNASGTKPHAVSKCTARPVEHIGSKLIVYSLKGSRQNSSQSFAAYKLGVSSIVPNGLLPQTVSQWYISPHGLQYICTSKYVLLCTMTTYCRTKNPTGCSVLLCFGLGLRGRKRLTYSQ